MFSPDKSAMNRQVQSVTGEQSDACNVTYRKENKREGSEHLFSPDKSAMNRQVQSVTGSAERSCRKDIRNELEAWLTFLGSDKPEDIIELIEVYPEFREMYHDIYVMCRNTEKVMDMFSEELKILDRNTVKLMIDEMQDQIDTQAMTIDAQRKQLSYKDATIADKDAEIDEAKKQLSDKDAVIAAQEAEIAALKERRSGGDVT